MLWPVEDEQLLKPAVNENVGSEKLFSLSIRTGSSIVKIGMLDNVMLNLNYLFQLFTRPH